MEDSPLLWLDCEMTGLDTPDEQLLEVACVVTNNTLDVIEQGPSVVIHHPAPVLERMIPLVKQMHTSSGLVDEVLASTIGYLEGQEILIRFIRQHMSPGTGRLCGNTIWQDRIFIARYMPEILKYVHYRVIDVSSVKELVLRWYPTDDHAYFEKQKPHRAMDDVYESIAELRHYKKYFFV